MIIIDKDAKQVLSFRFSVFQTRDRKFVQVIEMGGGFPPTARIFDSVKEAFEDFAELMDGYAKTIPNLEAMTSEEMEALEKQAKEVVAKEVVKEMNLKMNEEIKELQKSGKIDLNDFGKPDFMDILKKKKKDTVLN